MPDFRGFRPAPPPPPKFMFPSTWFSVRLPSGWSSPLAATCSGLARYSASRGFLQVPSPRTSACRGRPEPGWEQQRSPRAQRGVYTPHRASPAGRPRRRSRSPVPGPARGARGRSRRPGPGGGRRGGGGSQAARLSGLQGGGRDSTSARHPWPPPPAPGDSSDSSNGQQGAAPCWWQPADGSEFRVLSNTKLVL